MFTLEDLALKNACLNTTKALPADIKLELLERYGRETDNEGRVTFFKENFTPDMLDGLLIAPFLYLELTDRYTAEEKYTVIEHLFNQAIGLNEMPLIQLKKTQPDLYNRLITDHLLTAIKSTRSILPTESKGLVKLDYENVETNESKLCESGKSYGHREYYQCVWAIAEDKNSQLTVYHFNPNRMFNQHGYLQQPMRLDDATLNNTRTITFVLHERSILAADEIEDLQTKGIPFKIIYLPTGVSSVALSYQPQYDTLTLLNIEAQKTYVYDDILTKPLYNAKKFKPQEDFLKLLNQEQDWKGPLKETLERYVQNRESWSKYTRPLASGLFHNPKTTAKNIAEAKKIIKALEQDDFSYDRKNVTKNGQLSKLLATVESYREMHEQLSQKARSCLEVEQLDQQPSFRSQS